MQTFIAPNMFDARCSNPACGVTFKTGEGFYEKGEKGYRMFCKNCVPVQISATAPVSNRRLTKDFEIYTPKEPENITVLRSMPGARWNGRAWSVSANEGDRPRVLELADRLGLDVDPVLRKITPSTQAEAAKSLGLYQYQVEGVDFLAKKQKALLGDQMGLGKTVQSLMALDTKDGVLCVVPASLKYNWMDEIKQWRPDFRIGVVKAKAKFRWPEMGEILIISKDMLPDFLTPVKKAGEKYAEAVWSATDKARAAETVLIVDEAHKYKNYKTICSKKMGQLSRVAKKVIALTGTPLLNKPGDLFGVLSSVGMVGEVFGNWNRFKGMFNAYETRYGIEWGNPSAEVPERLRRVMLARRREEVLPNLPRKQYVNLTVDNSASVTKQLDALNEEFGDEMQATGVLPHFRAFSKVRADIAASRVDAMLEFVENCEDQDEPLVVFSCHLAPIDALLTREGWACITGDTKPEHRQEIVRAFQAGRLKGVALTVQAGGVGLTLTRASKMLFVDMDWVPANNWQAEDRICRIGQMSDKVTIYRMVSNHPLDRHVHSLIAAKIILIEGAINAVATTVVPASNMTAAVAGETDDQYRERMQAVEKAMTEWQEKDAVARKAHAKTRVAGILSREEQRAEAENKRSLLPLNQKRVDAIRAAFKFMLSVCDGAVEKDGQGFNKPDSVIGHCLLSTDLETADEVNAAYWMLTRYKRQLAANYPLLWSAA